MLIDLGYMALQEADPVDFKFASLEHALLYLLANCVIVGSCQFT